ncbi:Uncharacterised protein [Candidatus Burarchaeum australiense]|nr:Uncharacterised protein [Candidatus Burarchaeum australiense]
MGLEALIAIAAFLALLAALIGAAALASDATMQAGDAVKNERLTAAAVLENEIMDSEGVVFAGENKTAGTGRTGA